MSGNGDGSPGNPNKSVDLLTIFQSVAHKKNYSCLNIYLCLSTQTVVVSTQNDRFSKFCHGYPHTAIVINSHALFMD